MAAESASKYRGAQGLDPKFIAELEKQFGFDKPAWERFLLMVKNYAMFDFGRSYFRDESVIKLIGQKLPVSMSLGLWMTLISYAISIPLGIAKAVRDRHDGFLRNPWDQFECCGGHHYARVMSSYSLLTALSGFTYDVGRGAIGFAPRIHADNFQTFWALDGAWGTYSQKGKTAKLALLWGKLKLNRLDLPAFANRERVKVTLGDRAVNAKAVSHETPTGRSIGSPYSYTPSYGSQIRTASSGAAEPASRRRVFHPHVYSA